MDLRWDRPGKHLFVREVSERGIRVVDDWYTGSLLISASTLISDWPARDFESLDESLLEPVFQMQPDVVLIGTGGQQKFLSPELMVGFFNRGIGAETMTTLAACRTFNILVSEQRRVVAALLPVDAWGDQSIKGISA
jgi:uncharacterized protein